MNEAECFWCDKPFTYNDEDQNRFIEDENSDGDIIGWYEYLCPHCGEWTRV